MIVWPIQNTSFVDWANTLRLLRPDIDIQPRVEREDQWRQYAAQVAQSAVCQSFNVPRPDGFHAWQGWAEGLIKAFSINA